MNEFANLIHDLSVTNSLSEKKFLLLNYFSNAEDNDKLWALALLFGKKPKKTINTTQLKQYCIELTGIQEWLFETSYQMVGDLAETISLFINNQKIKADTNLSKVKHTLTFYLHHLTSLNLCSEDEKKKYILSQWETLNQNECFVFNKMITGGFRVGVSTSLISSVISQLLNKPLSEVHHRLSGNWTPHTVTWETLLVNEISDLSKPYPFYLCYALENIDKEFSPEEWYAEKKWDGIRGQIIKRENQIFIWSRGEELINEQFPEIAELNDILPNGTTLDGEIVCISKGDYLTPMPFNLLQKRLGRKKPGNQILSEIPVIFIAYDILEWEGKDIRNEILSKRRNLLDLFIHSLNPGKILISPLIEFKNINDLKKIRDKARLDKVEGIMIKRKNSVYLTGRKKGDWWKWKTDPYTIDCVLIYAQAGHGRRGGLYTDYTFAVKDGDKLVPFTKAYSGLTDKEIKEVDVFIKRNAVEKFGPVRTVKPELVFEIAFEDIQESKRHKSGVALRFPRILRWRKDKKQDEINTLEDLKSLLKQKQ
jgi:DNA ligase-1